jgi:hypothetical protein
MEMASKCSACDSRITQGEGFCSNCGQRVGSAVIEHSDFSIVPLIFGLLAGLVVGYSIVASVEFLPDAPSIFIALLYGLGLAVFLVLTLARRAFPQKVRTQVLLFSATFAGAYYFAAFLAIWVRI